MKRFATIGLIATSLTLFSAAFFAPSPARALDINPSTTSLQNGILPACDPSNTNLTEGGGAASGCGVDDAMQLIYNIIKYVTYITLSIAVLLIGYAGFTIMTSAGEAEKITQAKHMIQLLAIGIAIILLSTLIVQYVFKAIGVQSTNITNIAPGAK
jgi:hypothetical protein